MLLKAGVEHALEFNNDGYTPLHLAEMNGNTATSFHCRTKNG